jgi:hypothetical protein
MNFYIFVMSNHKLFKLRKKPKNFALVFFWRLVYSCHFLVTKMPH